MFLSPLVDLNVRVLTKYEIQPVLISFTDLIQNVRMLSLTNGNGTFDWTQNATQEPVDFLSA